MKILLATDGSPYSLAAVDEVARRPWPAGSEVKVISIVDLPIIPTTDPWMAASYAYEALLVGARSRAREAVDGALSTLRAKAGDELRVDSEIIEGTPKNVILEEAEGWGADLIIMGSHGYGSVKRFLLGSVSSAVVAHAKCSVEIVRSRQEE
jgi:nucleotide-binding universal stress UspA family protein